MTKTIQICDICKKEVKSLYDIPWLNMEGYDIAFEKGNRELCKDCAKKWVDYVNHGYFKEREVK